MGNISTTYINPATTHTIEEFIKLKYQDELTYRNLSILEKINSIETIDHCLIDDYLDELREASVSIELSPAEYSRYKYSPDLLSYDLYGTTQLDFVILLINDMIDPKEFDIKTIKLLYSSKLKSLLNDIYNSNAGYINQNRADNNILN